MQPCNRYNFTLGAESKGASVYHASKAGKPVERVLSATPALAAQIAANGFLPMLVREIPNPDHRF